MWWNISPHTGVYFPTSLPSLDFTTFVWALSNGSIFPESEIGLIFELIPGLGHTLHPLPSPWPIILQGMGFCTLHFGTIVLVCFLLTLYLTPMPDNRGLYLISLAWSNIKNNRRTLGYCLNLQHINYCANFPSRPLALEWCLPQQQQFVQQQQQISF